MPSSNFYLRGIATALGKTTSTAVQSDNRYLSLIADAPDVASDNELLRRISGSSDRASSAEYLRRISGSPVVTSTERYFKLWLASSETPDEPDEPLELTNAEKLSLPVDTAVGTEVHVTDGCTVVTFFDKSGFYAPFDTVNGKRRFRWVDGPDSMTGFDWFFTYDGTKWTYCEDVDVQDLFDPGNEDAPWDALFNGTSPVPDLIVHPAVQQLAAPSATQGGVFVSGGAQDGVYIFWPDFTSFVGAWLLGNNPNTNSTANGIIKDYGNGHHWSIFGVNGEGDDPLYYSDSDVSTPDTASNWKNFSDDSAAPITVTSVSLGDLVAGNKLGSVVRAVNGSTNGRNKYSDVLAVATDITWDGTKWTDGTTNGSLNTAFPDIGTADPVASEANWSAV